MVMTIGSKYITYHVETLTRNTQRREREREGETLTALPHSIIVKGYQLQTTISRETNKT
jgi:hypothetical protein